MISPTTTFASALEGDEADPDFGGYGDDGVVYDVDADDEGGPVGLASTSSTVSISFSPTSASGSVTPIDANGEKAQIDVQAAVRVQNSDGYRLYVGSTSSQLMNGSNAIDSVSSATTLANMPTNRWGYALIDKTSATDKTIPATTTYSAMPSTVRSSAVRTYSATGVKDETRYYMLSFAANIGGDKPAGTYKNSVTMSVVSTPLEVTGLSSISNMQDMTSAICSASEVGETKQLKDTRDGKYYWVAKLADNNCWMTQNLDLSLTTAGLNTATSDISSAWNSASTYPPMRYETSISTSTVSSSATGTRSWDQGMYVIISPTTFSGCGNNKANVAACSSQFIAVGSRQPSSDPEFYTKNGNKTYTDTEYDAHYLIGNC